MVPKVDMATMGLRLALIRAVPDAVVPPDVLVGFMLRWVQQYFSVYWGIGGGGRAGVNLLFPQHMMK